MTPLKSLPIYYNGALCYTIELHNSFLGFAESLKELQLTGRRLCIVSDSNVDTLYGNEVQTLLLQNGFQTVIRFVFPAGEEHKTLTVIEDLYEVLIRHGFDRSDALIALGGGVTGDMTGYAAATYLRGIRFIQVPTSLLSMVDSSIGGKTGVDFRGYKNMVGAFHMPSLVYVNLSVLQSLDKRQRASGMGEIIKHSLIRDKEYFSMLQSQKEDILDLRMNAITTMVFCSQQIKKQVVENDPKEKGERAHLNFGHTIGHGIESSENLSELYHGECVALGLIPMCSESIRDRVIEVLKKCGLYRTPTYDWDKIAEAAFHDKKADGSSVTVTLVPAIGSFELKTLPCTEVINMAKECLEETIR